MEHVRCLVGFPPKSTLKRVCGKRVGALFGLFRKGTSMKEANLAFNHTTSDTYPNGLFLSKHVQVRSPMPNQWDASKWRALVLFLQASEDPSGFSHRLKAGMDVNPSQLHNPP